MIKFLGLLLAVLLTISASMSSAQVVDPEYSEVLSKAEAGIDTGQFNLGLMYFKGEGVDQSFTEAIKWMTLAANQGLPEAQYILSGVYSDNVSGVKNTKTAYSWAKKAANQGHDAAQFQVGTMYQNGIGVEKKYDLCGSLVQKAADQGNVDAAFNLANLFRDQKKEKLAIQYYTKGAALGDPEAQKNLAIQYAISQAPLRNDVTSMMWLLIAEVNGAQVNNLFDLIGEEMSEVELTKAENAAVTCYKSEYKMCR